MDILFSGVAFSISILLATTAAAAAETIIPVCAAVKDVCFKELGVARLVSATSLITSTVVALPPSAFPPSEAANAAAAAATVSAALGTRLAEIPMPRCCFHLAAAAAVAAPALLSRITFLLGSKGDGASTTVVTVRQVLFNGVFEMLLLLLLIGSVIFLLLGDEMDGVVPQEEEEEEEEVLVGGTPEEDGGGGEEEEEQLLVPTVPADANLFVGMRVERRSFTVAVMTEPSTEDFKTVVDFAADEESLLLLKLETMTIEFKAWPSGTIFALF